MRSFIVIVISMLTIVHLTTVSHANPEEFSSGYKNGGICFYEHANFKGSKFCARSGERFKSLKGKWNNNFSSVQLDSGITVYICQRSNFQGKCRTIDEAWPNLGGTWNNKVSSIHISKNDGIGRIARSYENNNLNRNAIEDSEEEKTEERRVTEQKVEESNATEAPQQEQDLASRNLDTDENQSRREEPLDLERRDLDDSRETETASLGRDQTGSISSNEEDSTETEESLVCFYRWSEFRGRSFCIENNKSIYELSDRWNNQISSVSISGSAVVRLCEDDELEGDCTTLDSSQEFIGRRLNNRISSLRVKFLQREVPGNNQHPAEIKEEEPEEIEEVCFYSGKKYRGRSFCVPIGKTVNYLRGRKDDSISSFRIHGKSKVKIKVCTEAYLDGNCRTFYRNKRFVGWNWNDRISSIQVRKDRRGSY